MRLQARRTTVSALRRHVREKRSPATSSPTHMIEHMFYIFNVWWADRVTGRTSGVTFNICSASAIVETRRGERDRLYRPFNTATAKRCGHTSRPAQAARSFCHIARNLRGRDEISRRLAKSAPGELLHLLAFTYSRANAPMASFSRSAYGSPLTSTITCLMTPPAKWNGDS